MVWRFRCAGWIATLGLIACGGDDGGSGGSTSDGTSTTSSSTETSASATTNADSSGGVDSGSSSGAATTSDGDSTGEPVMPQVLLPRTSISADELAVLVNDDDPQSVAVAEYYVRARGIPVANVVHLQLPVGQNVLSQQDFVAAKAIADAALGDDIQAQAITWTRPFRVDCMSITSAFALGFHMQYCATPCNPTAEVDYYDSQSLAPWTDHGIRPAMMLAGADVDHVLELVDRGVASDGTRPFGDGYLVRTTDADRSSRWPAFPTAVDLFDHDGGLQLQFIDNSDGSGLDYIESTRDVLFYFTGLADDRVQRLGPVPGRHLDRGLRRDRAVLQARADVTRSWLCSSDRAVMRRRRPFVRPRSAFDPSVDERARRGPRAASLAAEPQLDHSTV